MLCVCVCVLTQPYVMIIRSADPDLRLVFHILLVIGRIVGIKLVNLPEI